MTWFDYLTVLMFAVVFGISVFCWIFTIVTLFRKRDDETLFPKKY